MTRWVDLSSRAKFRLTGPDRVRYLNGQVTANVARLVPGATAYALICTHKGRLEGDCFIRADGDALWIDAPGELREPLFARLSRYIVADDCELGDVTDDYRIHHALGEGATNRFGEPGRDEWRPSGGEAPEGGFLPDSEVERLRIAHGIPKWGAELGPDTLPQEARLEERALDFHKGCYTGQEVISRLRSVGHVNRLLVSLETDGPLAVGDGLFAREEAVEVGRVTSVATGENGEKTVALGYAKRTVAADAAGFRAGRDKNALSSAVKLRNTAAA